MESVYENALYIVLRNKFDLNLCAHLGKLFRPRS
ncbi:MAG: hypothetical protein LWX55_13130 [Deltaproteobacteria bacterium]|nr:hypothetical protein [Deltaproteobacteria bacterium]MDL1979013.1 hypothetical protein [Deltaproteobacteria bacterium]